MRYGSVNQSVDFTYWWTPLTYFSSFCPPIPSCYARWPPFHWTRSSSLIPLWDSWRICWLLSLISCPWWYATCLICLAATGTHKLLFHPIRRNSFGCRALRPAMNFLNHSDAKITGQCLAKRTWPKLHLLGTCQYFHHSYASTLCHGRFVVSLWKGTDNHLLCLNLILG